MVRSPQEITNNNNNSVDLVEAINQANLVDNVPNGLLSIDTNLSINTSENGHNEKSPSLNMNLSEKRKQHNCPYCDRSFTRPYRLNDHISFSHTDEKKYMCTQCSKNFSCKDKLKHHIDVKHENKKPNVKTKTKVKNIQDLKCEYPGCTKTFANKYNVKRHVENVHMKLKRKHEKNSNSNCSITNNSDSNPSDLNNSTSTPVTPSSSSQQTQKQNSIASSIANTIANVVNSVNQSAKTESNSTSTSLSNKQISKLNNNKNVIQTPLNLNNLNNSNGILNNNNNNNNNTNSPLTLVATSNGIGGITLTTLGSIHQQQQISNSQNTLMTPLNLTPITNGNTTFLTLNGGPLIIQQAQPQLIYQSPTIQVIPSNTLNQNNPNNGLMIKNSNISLNCLNTIQSNHPVDNNNLNSSTITITDPNSLIGLNTDFNQVRVTGNASDLVNSILIKSEQQQEASLVQDCHGLITFSDLENNNNENEQLQEGTVNFEHAHLSHMRNDNENKLNGNLNIQTKHEDDENDFNAQQGEDEKDGKIYTCARCPEICNSAKQLRKHVSENHEKEYECCICNINFNNRYAFLKHKYYHINLEASKIKFNDRQNEKNCTNQSKINSDLSSDSLDDDLTENDSKKDNIFDLNSLYKRSLSNLETLLNMNVPYSSSSQLVLNVIKSNKKSHLDNLDSDKLDHKLDQKSSSNLIKKIRQTSSCDICMKCFCEKKKLIAHRRLCEAKYGNGKTLPTNKRSKKKIENLKSTRKKQKLDESSSSDSLVDETDQNENNDQLKDLSDSNSNSNSINLNFLFD
ncbi:unnamed protein product [Brachionus calyciflorus]|uniref:C2H2-type domain-containing protein n=1 Tax=Brachionus calyciflorus TaxID=104777 RepID=A0A813M4Y9_9BILA|nr:unnamed protein product [Brachionus calyciflorus]